MANEKDMRQKAVGPHVSNEVTPAKSKAVMQVANKEGAKKPTAVKTGKPLAAKPEAKTVKPEVKTKTAATKPAEVKAKPVEDKAKPAAKAKAKPAPAVKPVVKPAKKQILFVASECAPFAGTGGLGEVIGSLPEAINGLNGNYSASVISPLYESIGAEYRSKMEFICNIYIPLGWRNQYCGLFKYKKNNTTYYFVDNEYYFKRPNLYGYYDDGERFAFFSRAVCELLIKLDDKPDYLHCNDWQTALVPIYYKLYYQYSKLLSGIKTVFTIHNIEYQGKYGKNILEDVFGITVKECPSLEHNGCINLVKGAMDYSDFVSTVSPTYANELEDDFYAHGLADVVRKNKHKMKGILNGVDTLSYNPELNPALFAPYSAADPKNKAKNKEELQKMLSLPVEPSVPVVAIISRLVSHKGLDLVRFAMNDLLKMNIQLVVLGKGDPDYESYFNYIQTMYNTKAAAVIAYNKDLSHKIYAGADIFLMPSKSEPCGLSQMMACLYGTVPVVRATGGLFDSIKDCGDGDTGNGFTFSRYDAGDMMYALERSVGLYTDYKDKWKGLIKRCMQSDFSWKASAKEYIKFYDEM